MISRRAVLVCLAVMAIGAVAVFGEQCSNPLSAMEPNPGGEPLRFALVTIDTTVFWVPVAKGFKDAAATFGVLAEHLGPAEASEAAEADLLQNLLEDGIDGVAVFVPSPGSLDRVIEEYLDAGVPILIFCTGEREAEKYGLAYIGEDNYDAGLTWGSKILELLGPEPQGKRVCMMTECPGYSCLEDRIRGGKEVLEPAGVIVDVVDTTMDRVTAYGVIESYYLANPDVAAFCGVDTSGTPVAAEFLSKNGLIGEIFVAGFDLTVEVVEGLKNGAVAFTIDQHPYAEGFHSMTQLYLWLTLGIKPSWIDTGGFIVTADDVAMYGLDALVEQGYR